MNFLKKLINKLKSVVEPENDVTYYNSSMQMAKYSPEELVEMSNRKKNEKEPPMQNDNSRVVLDSGNVVDVYPDGLPLSVLEVIDYTKFGGMLKQEQLLPPSYDRKPINVEIEQICGKPCVYLTFKSKTTESYRVVGIYGYYVSYSIRMDKPIRMMENNPLFIPVWRRFAESVMWAWDNGFRYSLIDYERKNTQTTKMEDHSTL